MAADSFPRVHTTGPVHHYIRTIDSANIYYLGTAEVTPKVRIELAQVPVKNDLSGPILDHQRLMAGKSATIAVMLTQFSKLALAAIETAGSSLGLQVSPGVEGGYSRGSLVFGQQTFELWQVFDFYGTNQAQTGLEQGYYWPRVMLVVKEDENGTSGTKAGCMFDAQPVRVPRTTGTAGYSALYFTDPSKFPNDVLLPQA